MGTNHPEADAEIINLTSHLLNSTGLDSHCLKIGHMGILRGILNQEGIQETQQNQIMQLLDKKQWDQALTTAQNLKASRLCLKTLKTLIETKGNDTTNILQQIDEAVKNYETAGAATQNLREIIELVKNSSTRAEILIEAGFARGLEYYTGMIFEAYVPQLEKTGLAIGGGGRYDKLIELFGGEPTPAVGFALGIDRIVLAIDKTKTPLDQPVKKHVIVIPLNKEVLTQATTVASTLRQAGIPTDIELMRRPVSKALSDADRRGLHYAVLIGPEEAKQGTVTLRNMKNREQKTTEKEKLITEITREK
jgi:histidyl-tRNA synthetase